MTNLGFGAADLGGAFVKDLALELGKAPATLVAYLKKHLPTTLTKRKNANKRLANFVTEDGVAGLRAHYTPTVAPELQRLRDENARLRERVQELEQAAERLETHLDVALETIDRHVTAREAAIEKTKALVAEANEQIEKSRAGEPARQEFLERINTDTQQQQWRQTNEHKQQTAALRKQAADLRKLLDEQDEQYARESKVVRFPSEKVRGTED